jgi:hypothetical protein
MVRVETANTNGRIGWCIEGHDLAASKLVAFRDKDREFVRVLMRENYVEHSLLKSRVLNLPLTKDEKKRLVTWIDITSGDLRRPT